jgi:hypothetical protein
VTLYPKVPKGWRRLPVDTVKRASDREPDWGWRRWYEVGDAEGEHVWTDDWTIRRTVKRRKTRKGSK